VQGAKTIHSIGASRALVAALVFGAIGALLIAAPGAEARAPVMQSVVVKDGHGVFEWTLPSGVQSRVIEVATKPTRDPTGYFLQSYLLSQYYYAFQGNETHFDFKLPAPGKYYVHLAGQDTKNAPPCPGREFSHVFEFTVTSANEIVGVTDVGDGSPICPRPVSGGGGGGGGGSGGGGGTGGKGDKLPPSFRLLRALRVQDVDKLSVSVRLSEPATVTASGTVTVRAGASKIVRLASVTRTVRPGTTKKLRLRLGKRALARVKRALKRGTRVKAKITVRARDAAGNTTVKRLRVRLTR
jgi:hypothetical protein